MPIGWIRAYQAELEKHDYDYRDSNPVERHARAKFREGFKAEVHVSALASSAVINTLNWGDEIALPSGIASGDWTRVEINGETGFVRTQHVVELAWVARRVIVQNEGEEDEERVELLTTTLEYEEGSGSRELIWGDCVQILERGTDTCRVRARGSYGHVPTDELTDEPLMEVYFIDVGQGDGVLVSTPGGRHILIDGGLERSKQLTGKNAADFVDWKFFGDYGDYWVRLDSLMASHSDNDHYGGLHDLVRDTKAADRELDCLGVHVDAFHHPGLSRWEKRDDSAHTHHDGLGPREVTPSRKEFDYFVRLLDDKTDAEAAIVDDAADELSGPWKWFIRDVLENDKKTKVERLGLTLEGLEDSAPLPDLWDDTGGYAIKVLGPVTVERETGPALPDLGPKSYNTNGHSICLRLDMDRASILLTGDLNKPSMDWLTACYGERMGAWLCDVAKACHHGSHKISYRFLQAMRPAATVISSGDAEGHAHPRPEVVGASATTGRIEVDHEKDVLLTPLVYMTEVERSVTLGAVDRIDFARVPDGDGGTIHGTVLGRNYDELNKKAQDLLSPDEKKEVAAAPASERDSLEKQLVKDARKRLKEQEKAWKADEPGEKLRARYSITVPKGPVSPTFHTKSVWRSRVMQKNHYGLVNVRTDGKTVMCATLDETKEDWILHTFPARTRLSDDG